MTTAEPVIPSALLQSKDYDLFKCVRSNQSFLSALDLVEPWRFRLNRLEGPLLAETEKSRAEGGNGKRGYSGISGGIPGGDSNTNVTDYVCEVTLQSLGQPIGEPLITSHSADGRWGEWIFFPINICQLPLDAMVVVSIQSAHDGVIGTCVFHPFSFRGELKAGTRRYPVRSGGIDPNENLEDWEDYLPSPDWDKLERDFKQGRMTKVPWMDQFAEEKLSKLQEERQVEADCSMLVIEFGAASNGLPIFHLSVPPDYDALAGAYSATPSPFVPYYDLDINMENLSENKAATLSKSLHMVGDKDAKPSYQQVKQIKKILSAPPIRMDQMKIDETAVLWQFRHWLLREPEGFVPFMQCVDWSNDAERQEAEALIPKWRDLSAEDALLLLSKNFRRVLSLRRHAVSTLSRLPVANLCVFLLQLVQGCRYDIECELADFLIERAQVNWPLCSSLYWYVCVEEDTEKIAASNPAGRARGRGQQQQESSKQLFHDLKTRLLETLLDKNPEFRRRIDTQVEFRSMLVSVHGQIIKEPTKDRKKRITLLRDTIKERSCGISELFATEEERVAAEQTAGAPRSTSKRGLTASGSSRNNLGDSTGGAEGSQQQEVGEDQEGEKNQCISKRDGSVLLPTHPHIAVDDILYDDVYIFKSAKQPLKIPFRIGSKKTQEQKEEEARERQEDEELAEDDERDPLSKTLPGVAPDPSIMVSPDTPPPETSDRTAAHSSSSPKGSPSSSSPPIAPSESQRVGLMWKSGDDVRQDQLVIQMIELIDGLLKQNGLDLCLTPYKVLATSPQDGFLEIVPKVATLQDVQRETVFKYLQRNNEKDDAKVAVCMDRFVKSCAGYCVITFLLGIGDRHLENLLITTDGRLFHIDFGFILGKDPKPFPPPMKLNKEMILAMGGVQSQQFRQFKTYCCSAYSLLRKHSRLLLHLLLLMVDAGIPDIADGRVDPRINLMKVQDKLRLELNDAEATQYIQEVIQTASAAFFTNVWDVVHEVVQDFRK